MNGLIETKNKLFQFDEQIKKLEDELERPKEILFSWRAAEIDERLRELKKQRDEIFSILRQGGPKQQLKSMEEIIPC